jgi:hypothetical protein
VKVGIGYRPAGQDGQDGQHGRDRDSAGYGDEFPAAAQNAVAGNAVEVNSIPSGNDHPPSVFGRIFTPCREYEF